MVAGLLRGSTHCSRILGPGCLKLFFTVQLLIGGVIGYVTHIEKSATREVLIERQTQ